MRQIFLRVLLPSRLPSTRPCGERAGAGDGRRTARNGTTNAPAPVTVCSACPGSMADGMDVPPSRSLSAPAGGTSINAGCTVRPAASARWRRAPLRAERERARRACAAP